jgi:hypothetical protein
MNSNELKQKSIKEQMEFIFNKIDSDDYLSLREIMLDNYYIPVLKSLQDFNHKDKTFTNEEFRNNRINHMIEFQTNLLNKEIDKN